MFVSSLPFPLTVGEEVEMGLCKRALISKIRLAHKAGSLALKAREQVQLSKYYFTSLLTLPTSPAVRASRHTTGRTRTWRRTS